MLGDDEGDKYLIRTINQLDMTLNMDQIKETCERRLGNYAYIIFTPRFSTGEESRGNTICAMFRVIS